MNVKNNKKLFNILKIILIIILIISISNVLIRCTIDYLVDELESLNFGVIELPNLYAVHKISASNLVIVKISNPEATGGDIIIRADIQEIGWNDRFVIYKRVSIGGLPAEVGIIDTEENEVYILPNGNIEEKLYELNVTEEIKLGKVEKIFLEARKK